MQKLVTIYLDNSAYAEGKMMVGSYADKNGLVEEHLTDQLAVLQIGQHKPGHIRSGPDQAGGGGGIDIEAVQPEQLAAALTDESLWVQQGRQQWCVSVDDGQRTCCFVFRHAR